MNEALQYYYDYYTQFFKEVFTLFEQGKDAATESTTSVAVSDGMTVVIGLVVVLATLLVLTGIFYAFGFIMDKINSPKSSKKQEVSAKPAAPVVSAPAPAPVVQSGISNDVVAAIAAAVTMMAPEGKRYAVRSVSRKDASGRSAWAAAGVADNTRPF